MCRPISISLSPNTEKDDIRLAFKLLWQPWRWKGPSSLCSSGQIADLENEFKKYLGAKNAISFNSGRSSLLAILSSFAKTSGDEVLLQAFTCNAVANPIIWAGLKPVYADVNEQTFNIDAEDLKRKITAKSKAVIVQHTFGLPADMDEILKICQEHNLILIEDCAHSLGAEYGSTSSPQVDERAGLPTETLRAKVGTFGKVAFFSFSRDKVISSVYGGMVATNDDELAKKIKDYQEKAGYPSYFWIKQQLLHPVLMNWLILPTYSIFGKYLLILFQWLHILSKAVHWKEKRGLQPGYFPKKLPNAMAILALNQFKKLEKFNLHRKEISEFYVKELLNTSYQLPGSSYDGNIFLRFAAKHPKAHEIIRKAWDNNLLIGDWYTTPIAPHDTKSDKLQYVSGSCPKAEKLAKETLNLPTHINISREDAKKITEFLKQWM
jgi:dTDP-4-amino-4,6-dideoxygalactose transaminase